MSARTCSVSGCARTYRCKGFCDAHYRRWMHRPDSLTQPIRRYQDPRARDASGNKRCSRCEDWLPQSAFAPSPQTSDGLYWQCRECRKSYRRDVAYNLLPGQYERMIADQGGACAICRSTDPAGTAWFVDHDHRCCPKRQSSCGACVRGLLCSPCNTAIGMLHDDPIRMRAAADYVERTSSVRGVA